MNEALGSLHLPFARSVLVHARELDGDRGDLKKKHGKTDVWVFIKHNRPSVAAICRDIAPRSLIFLDVRLHSGLIA